MGRPILLERHWPVHIVQELYSIVLVGLRAIFKVQPANATDAALARGRGLARRVRPTNLNLSGTGQFSSFRNCIVLYLLACVQFSKFSPPSLQRRHLPVAGVWPGKFGRPILLERHWPVLIFQELCSIVLVGLRAISKVQPAKSTEAALALGRGLAMKVRPTNPIGAAQASSHLSGIVKCERKLSSAAWFSVQRRKISWL